MYGGSRDDSHFYEPSDFTIRGRGLNLFLDAHESSYSLGMTNHLRHLDVIADVHSDEVSVVDDAEVLHLSR